MVFSKVKLAIAGLLTVAMATIIGLGYRHYTSLLSERDILKANNAVLETAVGTQQTTIDAQTAAISEWDQVLAELSARMEEMERVQLAATQETRRLNALFSEHDLRRLSFQRPGLIEPRINDGSDRAIRLLECATGAGGADCPD
ncbi:hypothetical protein RDJLphi1_gp01 [Roseobacter phage RDJL Phi 1]|uniref:Uncharacterized protein n=1 Tax=Roseobacter phage RDJL Phi 1 TaxID=562742 RepID=F4YXL1_9CAUD|nr:hypothetical protein RDJLphi1_gp01 [Roseobacter phage RDJL Phi 1]ADK73403.1 hypothetical protein RDJLphi1_gp01 [Roseobacter phage RDJL Phi 1]